MFIIAPFLFSRPPGRTGRSGPSRRAGPKILHTNHVLHLHQSLTKIKIYIKKEKNP